MPRQNRLGGGIAVNVENTDRFFFRGLYFISGNQFTPADQFIIISFSGLLVDQRRVSLIDQRQDPLSFFLGKKRIAGEGSGLIHLHGSVVCMTNFGYNRIRFEVQHLIVIELGKSFLHSLQSPSVFPAPSELVPGLTCIEASTVYRVPAQSACRWRADRRPFWYTDNVPEKPPADRWRHGH